MNFILARNRNFSGQNSPLLLAEKHFATGLNPKKFYPVFFLFSQPIPCLHWSACHLLQNDYFCRQHSCFCLSLEREKTEERKIFIDDRYTHKIE